MTTADFLAEWRKQVPDLTDQVVNIFVFLHPNAANFEGCPVTWEKTEEGNFKGSLTLMETLAYDVIRADGVVLELQRRCSQPYISDRIKDAIHELAPYWTEEGAFSTPVKDAILTVKTNGIELPFPIQNSLEVPGIDVDWKIEFDTPLINAETIKATVAYNRSIVYIHNGEVI
jgi:hypothetical protein